MAYDGFAVAAIVKELNEKLTGGRIAKIAQPEKDALILTIKTAGGQLRLLMSADASLPLVYLCSDNKPSPMTAPAFCMLLRKYLANARIISVKQPGLERIIRIELEHYDEMGDLKKKTLVCEIMGKHSNIILLDENERIVDAIKRVSAMVSSVREVLPGKDYFVAGGGEKADPLMAKEEDFLAGAKGGRDAADCLMDVYMGISPMMATEIVRQSGIEERMDAAALKIATQDRKALYDVFALMMDKVRKGEFSPCIYYDKDEVAEFSAINTGAYPDYKEYDSMSALLEDYYSQREEMVRIRQRSADLRRIVVSAIERAAKKLKLQEKQLADTEKREKLKLCGELITAYAYQIEKGAAEYEALNYHDNSMMKISLDPELSAMENAGRYYEKYQKQKRTYEALSELIKSTESELEHLRSVQLSLDIARREADLAEIRRELKDTGVIKKKSNEKKEKTVSRPMHYVTEDGFHIYVGRNNYQNDELTFKFADNGDWWFHAKKTPGSHVIVKTEGRELPDKVYEQAAALAAFYSTAAEQEKAEVDYLKRKDVKKPSGSAPGFVVYYTNYSMAVKPGIVDLTEVL